MDAFNFDTGARGYEINGYTVWYNPTDTEFISRFYKLLEAFRAKQDELSKSTDDAAQDPEQMSGILLGAAVWARGGIDALLGEGAAQGILHGVSPYSLMRGTRTPLWVPLFDHIACTILDGMDELPEDEGGQAPELMIQSERYREILARYKG